MARDEGLTVVLKSSCMLMGIKKEDRYLCGPRVLAKLDQEKQRCNVIRAAMTNVQLTRECGADLIVSTLRAALGAKPIQETR